MFIKLDFITKYGIVVFNGIFIAILLLIVYIRKGKDKDDTYTKNVLFVIAHPDDEAMFRIFTN